MTRLNMKIEIIQFYCTNPLEISVISKTFEIKKIYHLYSYLFEHDVYLFLVHSNENKHEYNLFFSLSMKLAFCFHILFESVPFNSPRRKKSKFSDEHAILHLSIFGIILNFRATSIIHPSTSIIHEPSARGGKILQSEN